MTIHVRLIVFLYQQCHKILKKNDFSSNILIQEMKLLKIDIVKKKTHQYPLEDLVNVFRALTIFSKSKETSYLFTSSS